MINDNIAQYDNSAYEQVFDFLSDPGKHNSAAFVFWDEALEFAFRPNESK
jgi:hypothetical protein